LINQIVELLAINLMDFIKHLEFPVTLIYLA